jgi:hypothetical protein
MGPIHRAMRFAFLICTVILQHGNCLADSSLPAAAPPPPPRPKSLPKNYGMILFRAFEILDVFGPLEALSILARNRQLNLYLIVNTMDTVTTAPASAGMNAYNSSFVSSHTISNIFSETDI